MQKKNKFWNVKALSGFALVGAVGAAGLFGAKADFRDALGMLDCVPRMDQERQAFDRYMNEIQSIAREETEFQVQALREALKNFNPHTAEAIAGFIRATGPEGSSVPAGERARLLSDARQAVADLRRDFADASNYEGIGDFAFNTQETSTAIRDDETSLNRLSADCPNGLSFRHRSWWNPWSASGLIPRVASRPATTSRSGPLYYNPDRPTLGVKVFDEDQYFYCVPTVGGGDTLPAEVRHLRLRLENGVADLTACTVRTEIMGSQYVVRTCSSVNLLDPWTTETAPDGVNSSFVQSLKILGDTGETALFHPEAIRMVDRDHAGGRVPYRATESAWMAEHLAEDTRFSSRCKELVEAPDMTLHGAIGLETPASADVTVGGDVSELIDPWANEGGVDAPTGEAAAPVEAPVERELIPGWDTPEGN